MSKEKLFVLNMLKEGKITEEEALSLLQAMGEDSEEKGIGEDFDKFAGKLSSAVEAIIRKTTETISNIDLDDINFNIGSNFNFGKFRSKTDKSKSLELSDIEKLDLEVENNSGNINISPWDNSFMEVKAQIAYDDKQVSPSDEFFSLELEEDKIKVGPVFENYSNQPFKMDLAISLPRRKFEMIKLSGVSGNINLSSLESDKLELRTQVGDVELSKLIVREGEISATTSKVDLLDFKGELLKVNTTNGRITVDGIDAKEGDFTTVNGPVRIRKIGKETEKLDVECTNGSVKIYTDGHLNGIKALIKRTNAFTSKTVLSDKFTSVVQGANEVSAYTENYQEDGEGQLLIQGLTVNGSFEIH